MATVSEDGVESLGASNVDNVFKDEDLPPEMSAPAGARNENSVELMSFRTINNTSEASVSFYIKDETSTNWQNSRFYVNLPYSTAVADLYSTAAKEAGYVEGTFDLVWRRQDDKTGEEEVELDRCSTATLFELNMSEEPKKTYVLIREKDEKLPERIQKEVPVDVVDKDKASSQASTNISSSSYSEPGNSWKSYSNPAYNTASNYSSGYSSGYSNYGYSSYYIKSDTGFVGLVNQAMTCYLNSLLQTLYMTPEFRNAIYRWKFDPKEEDGEASRTEATKCIPYQLQRLFLQLQSSDKRAVETTDITTSFGWDSSEAWQQHDVQELCRVMFDALEKRFKRDQHRQGNAQVNLINELYQGTWKDYVRCSKCGHESARQDTFLDIPLVIKPFGSTVTYSSVEEALKAFVESETLEEDNQYFCERCKGKQDALKGLKFTQFPYLLTLQLKRFDFDYSTMHRIKLNDRMTFPKLLNLNKFISGDEEKPSVVEDVEMVYGDYVVDKFDDPPPSYSSSYNYTYNPPSYSEVVASEHSTHKPDINVSAPVEDGGDTENKNNEEEEKKEDENEEEPKQEKTLFKNDLCEMFSDGPYVYELFSIMIHSGSAIGGHYYAYIKSLKDKKWYCFNDQSVSRITQDDIEQTFGGTDRVSKGYYSAMYSSSANAYMLMYRRVENEKNEDFMDDNNFPAHLQQEIEAEKEKQLEKQRRQEMEKKMCKFKLFGNHPVNGKLIEKRIEVNEDTPLPVAVKMCCEVLEFSSLVPVERCRLVKYDDYSETLDQSLDLDEFGDQTFGQVVGGARSYYSFELFVETRTEEDTFKKYNKGGMKLKIHVVDLETGEVKDPIPIRAEHTWTIEELKIVIGDIFSMEAKHMNLVLEMYNDGRHMPNNEVTLRGEGLYRKHSLFASSDPYDSQKPYNESKMREVVDIYVNSILLNITLPPRPMEAQPLGDKRDTNDEEIVPDLIPPHFDEKTEEVGEEEEKGEKKDEVENKMEENKEKDEKAGEKVEDGDKVEDVKVEDVKVEVEDVKVEDTKVVEVEKNNEEQKEKEEKNNEIKDEADSGDKKEVAGKKREIQMRVDRRTTLAQLKEKLAPVVGVESLQFKMYRVYSNQQEYEMERLSDTLLSTPSESKLVVRLGRALQPGEHRVKLYLLRVNEGEFFNLMMESIVAKNTSIKDFKKQIVEEAKKQGVECELRSDRLRLRKKIWRTPGTVYLDYQLIDKDIYIYGGSEMFVEPLEDEEIMKVPTQMQVYIRRWRPSEYIFDPMKEVILDSASPDDLKKKISKISGIAFENVSIAKGTGSFPADMSALDVESDLEWNPPIKTISQSPFSLYDDGGVIYYKDSEEKLSELSTEKKNELQKAENSRLSKHSVHGMGSSSYSNYSSYRKERALKIYTEDDTTEKDRED